MVAVGDRRAVTVEEANGNEADVLFIKLQGDYCFMYSLISIEISRAGSTLDPACPSPYDEVVTWFANNLSY